MAQQTKSVLIIGAGLGSLASALRLSSRGYKVTILEKHHQAGGRLNQIKKDGFTFDTGPSFFSMSYEFDELFRDCGIENPLQMHELNPVYGVYFSDREKPFLIHKNLKKLAAEFEEIEPNFIRKALGYLEQAKHLFHDTEHVVVKRNYNSLIEYAAALTRVPLKHSPLLFRSMWTELERHFDSEEVKIIFSLVAFFLGATPFDTPAVYSLLNYTELQHDGYWNIKGGMYQIVHTMLGLLEERGVAIHYNTEIQAAVTNGKQLDGFLDQNGKHWQADLYISNSDAAAFRGRILNRAKFNTKKLDKMDWTLAPFTIYLGVKGKIPDLYHHTYFLGDNFKEYADKIFKTSVSPDKPYYYVNVSSKSNPQCAPPDCENLFILCPVPDLRYKPDWSDREKLADNILEDLSKRINYDLVGNTVTRTIWDPIEWQDKFHLYRGSGLGLAHGLNQVAAMRPKNKDEQFNNLYYVGASTVPGTGLPIVVISSKLVLERIEKEHPCQLTPFVPTAKTISDSDSHSPVEKEVIEPLA